MFLTSAAWNSAIAPRLSFLLLASSLPLSSAFLTLSFDEIAFCPNTRIRLPPSFFLLQSSLLCKSLQGTCLQFRLVWLVFGSSCKLKTLETVGVASNLGYVTIWDYLFYCTWIPLSAFHRKYMFDRLWFVKTCFLLRFFNFSGVRWPIKYCLLVHHNIVAASQCYKLDLQRIITYLFQFWYVVIVDTWIMHWK